MVKTVEEALDTFVITACGVITDDVFAFVAQANEQIDPWAEKWEQEEPIPSRILSHNARLNTWGWWDIYNFDGGHIAGGEGPDGHLQAIFVNHMSRVGVFNY